MRGYNQCGTVRCLLLASVLCLPILGGGIVCGQWEQTHKLTADDAAAGDLFGCIVSVSGNIIAVGAPTDEDAGSGSGSAYVFDATTGEQLHKLTAADAAAEDLFGVSVSVSGNTIVVAAFGNDDAGDSSGSAYVFDATTGEQLHKLTAADAAAGDLFGVSVSISGNIIVVGAVCNDDAGSGSGSAYVFDATTGEQLHKLTSNDAAGADLFGHSVSINGNTIVVGAYGDDDGGDRSGSAYVFDATTGEQLHKLTANDAAEGDWFGVCVAVSGDTAIVGALYDPYAGDESGSAYVFNAATGEQLHKLTADDAADGDRFGRSVSVSGNTIVVGADGNDDAGWASGASYGFDATTGEQLHKLTSDDAAMGDYFGYSVSVSGNTIVVGADGNDDACPGDLFCDSGSTYVFQLLELPCPADITGLAATPDGTVDVHDLLLILAQWGTAGPECDITGPDGVPDGVVDVHDLLAVLGAWGPCG